ncbi:metal-dependent phosphohydrolase [Bordetella ansorpii]|uniref:Metal-dependent phosphohydrolase n=1 Tax=Bordetella ansorpii TaxID=288768 RepID=A0A146B113_9BORD|nr:HD domain-containing phosphohydrolase [Bordetella ansorpii]CZZ95568.1 metal-dependent phosphohydrolase [Bordetella ansorpii]
MKKPIDARPTLLLVDDEPTNLQVLRHTLQDDYRLFFARDGRKGIELARMEHPDLILLDIMMPDISGYEVCAALKQDEALQTTPIIFITALASSMDEQYGFDVGAVDYITKPFSPAIVRARVRNHLSLVQVQALRDTRLQIIQRLGAAAEYKDNETGLHVIRMSHYAKVLALAAGYSQTAAEEVLHASPMHDIGKIGIPDAILKKPGKLTDEEWTVMRRHPIIGGKIIGDHRSGLLRMARIIAEGHHEKWDGTGYPRGLKGEQIPHVARIVALVDVFDALTSERPYKSAWPVDEAVDYIVKASGTFFDPELVPLFVECLPDLLAIRDQWVDTASNRLQLF